MWLYYKKTKTDVFVVHVQEPDFDQFNNDRLDGDVYFWNPRVIGGWDVDHLLNFLPPKGSH